MFKKTLILAAMAAFMMVLANCGSAPLAPAGSGSLYTGVTANYNCLSNDSGCVGEVGSKTGKACTSAILGLIATGDMSIKAAAANGGISKVTSVDYSQSAILGGLYVTSCTIVNGN